MGSNQSTSITETISQFNQNVNNITQNITNQSSASCDVIQNVSVVNNGNLYGCTYDVELVAANVCNLAASAASTSDSSLVSELQAAVQATAAQTQSASNDFLSTAFSNQGSDTTINEAIQNIVQNNVTSNDLTTCIAQASLNQQGNFVNNGNIYCPTSNPVLTFGANAQQQLVANCLSNSVISAVAQDQAVMSAITAATTAQTVTNTGLGSVIKSALSAYENIIIAVAAICMIVLLGVLVFGGYILLSPAGQQSITTATNAAASMAGGAGGKMAMMAFSSNKRVRLLQRMK